MENFKVNFYKVPEDEKEFAENGLKNWKAEGAELIEGEYEKTPQFLEALKKTNEYIQGEIRGLGLEPRGEILPERVHIVNAEIAAKLGFDSDAAYHPLRDHIVINWDQEQKRPSMYTLLIHEGIHYYSYNSTLVLGDTKDIKNYRSGYRMNNAIDNHTHFRGFNEAVVEKMTLGILQKHAQEISKALAAPIDELIEKRAKAYGDNIAILDLYIKKVSDRKGISQEEVWTELQKGEFTGELMHLRDAEKIFGSGSLRVLGAFDTHGSIKPSLEEAWYEKFAGYFNAENQEDRDRIAKQILSERERLQYEKNSKR